LEDVPALAAAFAQRFAQRIGRPVAALMPDDARRLQGYAWPGNVRELQNVIERAVITAVDGRLNLDRALPDVAPGSAAPAPAVVADASTIRTLKDLEELERDNLRRALEAAQGRIAGERGAAALLGMNPSTLRSRLKALGLKAAE
jgi:transcriptional regulator with GAF, ATPase, and Fis domain